MTNVQNVRQMPGTFGMKFGTAKRFGNTALGSLGIWIFKMFPSCWSLQRQLYLVLEKYKISDAIYTAELVECTSSWRNFPPSLGKNALKEEAADLSLGYKKTIIKKFPCSLTNWCLNCLDLVFLTVSEPGCDHWEFSCMLWCCFPQVHIDLVCSSQCHHCTTATCPSLLAWYLWKALSHVNKQNEKRKRMKVQCLPHNRH